MTVQIRRLKQSDLPSLEWDGEYVHFRRLYQDIYSNSRSGNSILWVADLSGKGIIGQLFVQLKGTRMELADGKNRAYIFAFRVRNPYRCQGIGSLLLNRAEIDLVKRDFNFITLNVAQDNNEARNFYENRGYKVVSVEAGRWYYIDHLGRKQEVNEPSWRMIKMIKRAFDG